MPVRLPYLLIVLITLSIVTKSIEIRCYAGLKYVVGQEVIQDTGISTENIKNKTL